MGRFAILRRLWRNRDTLLPILDLLGQIVRSVTTLAEIKKALSEGIEAGQLDEPLERFQSSNQRAKDYIRTGR